MTPSDSQREFLRHTIAAHAYRAAGVLLEAPEGFASTRASETTRTAGQILAHMGDLIEWSVRLAKGEPSWNVRQPAEWTDDVARFFEGLERLFQGPIADALTHVGQMAMLRRIAGSPMPGENYYKVDIAVGRVGADQAEAKVPS